MTDLTRDARSLVQRWQLSRGAVLDLLDRLPEPAGGLRVWPGGRTTLELSGHIADETAAYLSPVLDRPEQPVPPPQGLAAALNLLATQAEEMGDALKRLSEQQLSRVVTVRRYGLAAPAAELVQLHIQHEAYHAGQLVYHARLFGIHPPYFFRNLWAFASKQNWLRTEPQHENQEA